MSLEHLRAAHASLTRLMRHHGLAAAGTPGSEEPEIARDELPLATCYVDEDSGVLAVGLDAEAAADRERHGGLIGGLVDGAPVHLTYVRVTRDAGAVQPPWKQRDARPLRGGVRMGARTHGDGTHGTLNLVVWHRSGGLRAIASSHVVGEGTGQLVGQAEPSSTYGAVLANPPLAARGSDAALTSITNPRIEGAPYTIWRASDRTFTIRRFATSDETRVGTNVWMQGARTELLQVGRVRRHNVTVADAHGTLTNQVYASYFAQRGDSGAPIFYLTYQAGVVVYVGIHVGRVVDTGAAEQELAFYSPWEGVRDDLRLDLMSPEEALGCLTPSWR